MIVGGTRMSNGNSFRPKVAIFDFASCEGCQLQIVNLEEQILKIVEKVDIVTFREAMKESSDQYDIAFVEGSVIRPMDMERLKKIRSNAKILIALGDCAVTGCVNKLRNDTPIDLSLKKVYNDQFPNKSKLFDIKKTKALSEIIPVDFHIRGCPVRKEQILYYIQRLSWMPLHTPMDNRFGVTEKPIPIDNRSLVQYNPHKCILCRRCDAVCRDALGIDALGLVGKGPEVVISTPKNIGFDNNGCIRCGQCITSCSCGSLVTDSCIELLVQNLKERTGMKIALDSIALSSYVEKNLLLGEIEPSLTERYIIGALKEAGFDKVIQYDRFVIDSIAKDTEEGNPTNKKMLSWCKAAFNYVEERIPASKLARSEENAPWTMLLEEEDDVCLLSSCTALKGVTTFRHVLSAMELDELFKHLEINPEFSTPSNYEKRITVGKNHPGFSPVEKIVEANVTSLRVSKDIDSQIEKIKSGYLDLFPCLARCLTGGGNYPTIESSILDTRVKWLESLWEMKI
jgi:coenzyme F420-reducing hydrogenase gamma subunit